MDAESWQTTREVGQAANMPTESANEALEDMWLLRLILRTGDNAYSWAATDETRDLLDRAGVSLSTQNTPGRREEAPNC